MTMNVEDVDVGVDDDIDLVFLNISFASINIRSLGEGSRQFSTEFRLKGEKRVEGPEGLNIIARVLVLDGLEH